MEESAPPRARSSRIVHPTSSTDVEKQETGKPRKKGFHWMEGAALCGVTGSRRRKVVPLKCFPQRVAPQTFEKPGKAPLPYGGKGG